MGFHCDGIYTTSPTSHSLKFGRRHCDHIINITFTLVLASSLRSHHDHSHLRDHRRDYRETWLSGVMHMAMMVDDDSWMMMMMMMMMMMTMMMMMIPIIIIILIMVLFSFFMKTCAVTITNIFSILIFENALVRIKSYDTWHQGWGTRTRYSYSQYLSTVFLVLALYSYAWVPK